MSSKTDLDLKSSDLDSKILNLNPKSLLVAFFKKYHEAKSLKKEESKLSSKSYPETHKTSEKKKNQ